MNMHAPQSTVTATELLELAAVSTQIISPRECKPIISVVQDIALGIFRITKGNVYISEKDMMNLMATNFKFDGIMPKPAIDKGYIQKWTGRQAISTIIPNNITLKRPNKNFDDKKASGSGGEREQQENYVIVENGELLQGTLDKTVYQDRTKGLVHAIVNECGNEEARLFFDNTQQLICNYLVRAGFSVGISDLIIDDDTIVNLKNTIHDMKVKVYDMIKTIHSGQFENKSINTNSEYFEDEVNSMLNKTRDIVGKMALAKIDDNVNRMINMVKSGSKGSILNVSQMIACLGQQNVDGKRIAYGFDDRTLPHYVKYDDGPDSHGFVENSFITGLSPQEFFFHAMGGREGLIDTAVKSVTGDTTIMIIENGVSKWVNIGDWIDGHLQKDKNNIKHFPEDRNMEFLELDTKVYIPTCDEDGNTSWGELTAVTRHDPSEKLYEFKTKSGRKVVVADSESMLVWNGITFEKKQSKYITLNDYVPVTASLPEPPIINTYVDMITYFPKTEYIYGTECYKAMEQIKLAKKKKNLPNNWWKDNNQKLFTVPYKRSGYLEVAMGRNNHIIKEGYIYVNGHRTANGCMIPEKFELNYDNGVFIGLYLAEGSTRNPQQVSIANTDRKIKDFTINWFNKLGIHNLEENWEGIDKITGKKKISENIVGNSTLLASFLDTTCGHGAKNKFVPDYAYNAPEEFITGLLNGYFSGDGTVDKYGGINASSISLTLIEGMAMLCSRIGVFSKLTAKKRTKDGKEINTEYVISINAQWANIFSEKVNFVLGYKNDKLKNICNTRAHCNYPEYNKIVKDKIISIKVISDHTETKLYDVTVPSTLNFAIANGLNIRDTSETGYLQRKLVKAMEDCKINYDYTVRNASGSIVQFLYGEDGVDPIKIESQQIPYNDMDYAKLCKEYLWTPNDDPTLFLDDETTNKVKNNKELFERLKSHFDQLIVDREFMIEKIFNGKKESSIFYPISFFRIITIARSMFQRHIKGVLSDLDPVYVLDTTEKLCNDLFFSKMNKGNKFLGILIRVYLSPKKVCFEYKFDKLAFDYVIKTVTMRFYESIANPSEMIGIVAAQSIGEPCTQLTLNSVDWNTDMLLKVNNKLIKTKIGKFIDDELAINKNIEQHPNDTTLGWIKEKNVEVLSCDEYGKISWKLVEAVTKHPPMNKDGSNILLKVITHSGREIIATKAKSFLKKVDNKIIQVNGEDIEVGDYLPVSNCFPEFGPRDQLWDISSYLDKKKYIFMTEVDKALEVYANKKNKFWFKQNQGNTFTVPYSRSDGFIDAYVGIGGKHPRRKNKVINKANCVYPKSVGGGHQACHIPEKIQMDNLFGFFIGAYLSEGCCTTHHVLISNVDDSFNKRIDDFCKTYTINYHIDERIDERGHSKTIRMHGMVLAELMSSSCGRVSYEKRIPPEFLNGNDDFIKGLLDGYFSGDGTFSKKQSYISVTSVSRELIDDIQVLLTRYNIQSRVVPNVAGYENAIDKGYNASLSYFLHITAADTQKFRDIISLTLEAKHDILNSRKTTIEYSRNDLIPDVVTKTFGKLNIYRNDLQSYINKCTDEDDLKVFNSIKEEEVVYDRIETITEIPSSHTHVYDLTVKDTRNFNSYNSLCLADTFHSSGISSASKTVRGVPRIKELLSVTKNIKSPSMNIYIKSEYHKDKRTCTGILNSIQTTYFKDIVTSAKIYFDPDDFNTTIGDDKLFLTTYKEFIEQGMIQASNLSPWLLRLEFNKDKLHENNLTMMDIHYTLHDFYEDSINAMFSDDNSQNLVCRIKLIQNDKVEENDMITELKALEKSILENIVIKGIKNVKKVMMNKHESMKYNKESMQFEPFNEWVLDTSGTNLLDILCHPKVDATRTISNDINEIYETLGIEAARQVLLTELYETLADLYVNYRHISLLVDTMTNKGYLLSIDRHGINRVDIGPLAKCSFEETTDMLIKAGIFSEIDKINGVSANIMLGQILPAGTGDTDIMLDEQKIMNTIDEDDEDDDLEYDTMSHIDDETKDNMCSLENLEISFKLPEIDKSFQDQKIDVSFKIV